VRTGRRTGGVHTGGSGGERHICDEGERGHVDMYMTRASGGLLIPPLISLTRSRQSQHQHQRQRKSHRSKSQRRMSQRRLLASGQSSSTDIDSDWLTSLFLSLSHLRTESDSEHSLTHDQHPPPGELPAQAAQATWQLHLHSNPPPLFRNVCITLSLVHSFTRSLAHSLGTDLPDSITVRCLSQVRPCPRFPSPLPAQHRWVLHRLRLVSSVSRTVLSRLSSLLCTHAHTLNTERPTLSEWQRPTPI
jgi:hypothetical protein